MQHEANDKVKVAAIQLEAKVGDIDANLVACENMANEAGKKGAKWIILPEFLRREWHLIRVLRMGFNRRMEKL